MGEIKPKKYYSVVIEGTAPIRLEYKILAEDENDAYQQWEQRKFSNPPLSPPRIDFSRMTIRKISIKEAYSSLITWIRNF